ncbi:MAG TPA: gephyrin-like molybdotransferase Glp [Candidatus Limnocylindria bacterium]|nr:gephyrin-like molybdotransferase Glp [Candidatus Limnocylindria bacterium]
MLSVEEALGAILAHARVTPTESLQLDRGCGRVPAAFRFTAAVDVPPFDNSSMDGFAVRAADAPGELRVVGESSAGAAADVAVAEGTAVRIMTGAPMPRGADAVVPLEAVSERDGVVSVPVAPSGAYLRHAGEDTRRGDVVELAAAPLTPAAIAVLASLGIGAVEARRRPRVAILSTGDELRAPGEPLGAGQIHDANSFSLAAAVAEAGGEAVVLPRAVDDPGVIARVLLGALSEVDLVVASGGVSVGRHDHVRTVIEANGSVDFWRIRVQPGKPLAFGTVRDRPVIGLPGNPVSALVTFEIFVRPLIRAMLGLRGHGRAVIRVVSGSRIGKDRERRAYLRVVARARGDGGYVAESAGGQGSHQLRPLAAANALVIVPEGEEAAEEGRSYDALLTGELA